MKKIYNKITDVCSDKKNKCVIIGSIFIILMISNAAYIVFELLEGASSVEIFLSIFNLVIEAILFLVLYRNAQFESQQKKMEKALFQSNKLANLGEMSSSIAHEINNPLTIISGRITKLEKAICKDSAPEATESISKIKTQIKRIDRIIKGLKSFSRDSENDTYNLCSFSDIIKNSVELTRDRIEQAGIVLILEIDSSIFIECNEIQIEQVVVNLINNSIDAISSLDEKWIKIKISPEAEAEAEAELTIMDSGKGIPADIVEKIMDPFFTTKEVGKGTGLGLSISTGIIDRHGGRIFYEQKNPNTTFVIKLKKSISFDLAIQNHLAWKSKLERYMLNPNGSLNSDHVSSDRECKLGKWIYMKENDLSKHSEYCELVEKHKAFHIEAARIIRDADEGKRSLSFLEEDSIYTKKSTDVINSIIELKNKLTNVVKI